MTFDSKETVALDGYLEPFIPAITSRFKRFQKWRDNITSEGGLDNFSKGFNKFGFNVRPNGDVVYREWAPNAREAVLIGEFSMSHFLSHCLRLKSLDNWNRISHPMTRDQYGVWEIVVPPNPNGQPTIAHDSKIKV